jgi:NAD(P)-dependent dehydrogenase (short-subunit alcohol dehydrogenase family)
VSTDFHGQVALVSGAAGGIGAATARLLAARGARVGVLDTDAGAVVGVAEAIAADGGDAVALAADVRDGAAVRAAVARLAGDDGPVDVLVSNAGVARHGRLEEFADEDWDLVLDVNLRGQHRLVSAVVPRMRRAGGGAIVITSSVHAFASSPLVAAYAASKAGIVALARVLALDYAGDGIRVNVVAPGSVDTPMLRAAAQRRAPEDPDAAIAEWASRHPIGRVLRAEEVAEAIAFLASAAASGITGTCQPVDGGLLARLSL